MGRLTLRSLYSHERVGLRVLARSLDRVRTVRDTKAQTAPRCLSTLVLTSDDPREMRFDSIRDRRFIFCYQPLLLKSDVAEFIFLSLLFTGVSGIGLEPRITKDVHRSVLSLKGRLCGECPSQEAIHSTSHLFDVRISRVDCIFGKLSAAVRGYRTSSLLGDRVSKFACDLPPCIGQFVTRKLELLRSPFSDSL